MEKEIQKSQARYFQCLSFDESSSFLFFPSVTGVKVIHVYGGALVRVIGDIEHTERFLNINLYQGQALKRDVGATESVVTNGQDDFMSDPCLIVTAFKKNRFFIFSSREPSEE